MNANCLRGSETRLCTFTGLSVPSEGENLHFFYRTERLFSHRVSRTLANRPRNGECGPTRGAAAAALADGTFSVHWPATNARAPRTQSHLSRNAEHRRSRVLSPNLKKRERDPFESEAKANYPLLAFVDVNIVIDCGTPAAAYSPRARAPGVLPNCTQSTRAQLPVGDRRPTNTFEPELFRLQPEHSSCSTRCRSGRSHTLLASVRIRHLRHVLLGLLRSRHLERAYSRLGTRGYSMFSYLSTWYSNLLVPEIWCFLMATKLTTYK